jgi:hypothetical protein
MIEKQRSILCMIFGEATHKSGYDILLIPICWKFQGFAISFFDLSTHEYDNAPVVY